MKKKFIKIFGSPIYGPIIAMIVGPALGALLIILLQHHLTHRP